MAQINFDARNVAPDEGRAGPIPTDWYNMALVESEYGPTEKSSAEAPAMKITAVFQVVDGQYKGRKIYHNFNMQNPSEKAEKIGRAQFSALCHAVNVLMCADTVQLHNIPLKGRVKLVPEVKDAVGNVQYEAKNEITAFKGYNDPSVQVGTATAAVKAPAAIAPPPTAPTAPATQWQQPAAQQPWEKPAEAAQVQAAPNVPPVAETTTAPVQTPGSTAASSPAPAPAPAPANPATAGQAPPPWMNQGG